MRDYYEFMDLEGYEKAEEQLASYDFYGYIETLKKVKAKAFKYDGDAMALIYFHNGVQDELKSINTYYKLSKSTYVRGKQCVKSLYLNKYQKAKRDELTPETKLLFDKGKAFETEFRKSLGTGVNMKDKLAHAFSYYPFFTKKLLDKNEALIFEAGFAFDGVLVLVNAICRNNDGSYSIYEIKNSSEVKEVHKFDMAIQYYVLKEHIHNIRNFNLVINENGEPRVIDFKDEMESLIKNIKPEVTDFKSILNSKIEPIVNMGEQCSMPYNCDFKGYCQNSSKVSIFNKLMKILLPN
jgi:CRISPR/Cas system-associated exonuclease Cas4 (RecB family)